MALAIMQIIVQYSIRVLQSTWLVFCQTVRISTLISNMYQYIPSFSIIYLIRYSFSSFTFAKGCRLFTLESVNLCRKYTFVFDLLLSMLFSTHWCVLHWSDFRLVQKAMAEHQSQMVWFRRLYVIFSRYMVINTMREMNVCDAELEIQIASSMNNA